MGRPTCARTVALLPICSDGPSAAELFKPRIVNSIDGREKMKQQCTYKDFFFRFLIAFLIGVGKHSSFAI
jgi:hypothetical protein